MVISKQLGFKDQFDFLNTHLQVINVFLPVKLTPKEIEVVASFMSLDGTISEDRFGTTARKMVRKRLKLSPGGLGNYLRTLKEKGFIGEKDNQQQFLPLLYPAGEEQLYQFKLKLIKG